jgi:hypothetical protein
VVVVGRLATYQSEANHNYRNDNHYHDIGSLADFIGRMIIVLAF